MPQLTPQKREMFDKLSGNFDEISKMIKAKAEKFDRDATYQDVKEKFSKIQDEAQRMYDKMPIAETVDSLAAKVRQFANDGLKAIPVSERAKVLTAGNVLPLLYNERKTDKGICYEVYMPGVIKEDIRIEIQKNVLVVTAAKVDYTKTDAESYGVKEMPTGLYSREIPLHEALLPEVKDVQFHNCVLELYFDVVNTNVKVG